MKEGEPITKVVRSLRSGQITIPAEFRKALGIEGDSLLQLTLARGELRIRPVRISEQAQGSPWLQELYEQFAPMRHELEQSGEQEINDAIDQAVSAVRRQKPDA